MIKFFRKIRQNMIKENKVSKYFLYAIGEIVLVVIGILIALSVNNWNEKQKLIKQELEILLELRDEIVLNIDSYKMASKSNHRTTRKSNTFLDGPKGHRIHPDSISTVGSLFNYYPLKIEQPILNTILNSSSEKIIKNKFLLEDLRNLKRKYNHVTEQLSYLDTFWNTNVANYLISSGLGSTLDNVYTYDKAISIDHEFYTLLIMKNALLKEFTMYIEIAEKESIEIIDKIEKLSF